MGKFKMMWKEMVVAYIKVLKQYFFRRFKESHIKPQWSLGWDLNPGFSIWVAGVLTVLPQLKYRWIYWLVHESPHILVTNSKEQSGTLEVNCFSFNEELSSILETLRFITMFKRAHHWSLSCLSSTNLVCICHVSLRSIFSLLS
jgi:hypothetical protein